MKNVNIAGLNVSSITKQEFLQEALKRIKANQKTFAITPYSEFLYRALHDERLLKIFNQANFSLADGIGLFWAKKYLEIPLTAKTNFGKIAQSFWQLKYSLAAILLNSKWIKSALPEKIVGADLIYDLAEMAKKNNLSIYLLGGFGSTAETVKKNLILKYPGIKISETSSKNPDDLSVVEDINKAGADILIVAYGPVKQEKWISKNLEKLNVKLAIGLGGTFDYVAGIKSVPPKFVRYSGLEWLWRLFTQPGRAKRIYQATFGLANSLWHYKVFQSLPLRPNAVCVILNKENKILVCQRNLSNPKIPIIGKGRLHLRNEVYWQFPQGGIDQGESAEVAGKREAMEETSLTNLEVVKISTHVNSYYWPSAQRYFSEIKKAPYAGQKQNVIYLRHLGSDEDVKLDNFEFNGYKWIEIKDIEKTLHPERQALAKIALEDLKSFTNY